MTKVKLRTASMRNLKRASVLVATAALALGLAAPAFAKLPARFNCGDKSFAQCCVENGGKYTSTTTQWRDKDGFWHKTVSEDCEVGGTHYTPRSSHADNTGQMSDGGNRQPEQRQPRNSPRTDSNMQTTTSSP